MVEGRRIIVLPFSDRVLWTETASGDETAQGALLAKTLQLRADGGTDFYTCGARALAAMKPLVDGGQHLPAIVIMTDGKSQGTMSTFESSWRADGRQCAGVRRHFRRRRRPHPARQPRHLDRRQGIRRQPRVSPRHFARARVQLNAAGNIRNELDRGGATAAILLPLLAISVGMPFWIACIISLAAGGGLWSCSHRASCSRAGRQRGGAGQNRISHADF